MRITLTADTTFTPGIAAKAGEVLVFTAPNTLSLHKADGVTTTPIDLATTPANVGLLVGVLAPTDGINGAASYILTKALNLNDAGITAAIGDFFIVSGAGRVTIRRAGALVGVVDMPKVNLDWLVFTGVLTPLT